jgi:hypothetical protein
MSSGGLTALCKYDVKLEGIEIHLKGLKLKKIAMAL